MDVTFTNVLEGARQYFQGLPAATGSAASPSQATHSYATASASPATAGMYTVATTPTSNSASSTVSATNVDATQTVTSIAPQTVPAATEQYWTAEQKHAAKTSMHNYQYSQSQPNPVSMPYQFSRPQSHEPPTVLHYSSHYSATTHRPLNAQTPHLTAQARPPSRQHEQLQTHHQMQSPRHHLTPSPGVGHPQNNVYMNNYQSKQPYYSTVQHSYPQASVSGQAYMPNHQFTSHSYSPHSQSNVQQHQQSQHQQSQHQYNVSTPSNKTEVPNTGEHLPASQSQSQNVRTTHNLPPIAALSSVNYHSNKSNREPVQRLPNQRYHRTNHVTDTSSNSTTVLTTSTSVTTAVSASQSQQHLQQHQNALRIPSQYSSQTQNVQPHNSHYSTTNSSNQQQNQHNTSKVYQYPPTSSQAYTCTTTSSTSSSSSSSTSTASIYQSSYSQHLQKLNKNIYQESNHSSQPQPPPHQHQQQYPSQYQSTSSKDYNYQSTANPNGRISIPEPIPTSSAANQQITRTENHVPLATTIAAAKQKRESPLDLSVKTVRTSADSTDDSELHNSDAQRINKSYGSRSMPPPMQVPSNGPYIGYENMNNHRMQSNIRTTTPATSSAGGAPKVDFLPNFNVQSLHHTQAQRNHTTESSRSMIAHPQHNVARSSSSTSGSNVVQYSNKYYHQQPAQQQPPQMYHPPTSYPSAYNNNVIQGAAHPTTYNSAQVPSKRNNDLPRIDFPTPGHLANKSHAMYPTNVARESQQRKRPLQEASTAVPNKIPKLDSWRQTIDQQIEQRLSSYANSRKQLDHHQMQQIPSQQHPSHHIQQQQQQQQHQQQQQQQQQPPQIKQPAVQNSAMPLNSKQMVNGNMMLSNHHRYHNYPVQNHPTYPPTKQQPYPPNNQYHIQQPPNHNQTYVPTMGQHMYPSTHPNVPNHPQQPDIIYQQNVLARTNSNPKINATTSPVRNNSLGGADKRVLSILRNSLEIKGAKEAQKKLEQIKPHDNMHQVNHMRSSGVQQPTTDVQAPLQPKHGISRQNVSPFPATNLLERVTNTPPMYKFHFPRAVDSVRFENDPITKDSHQTGKEMLYSMDDNTVQQNITNVPQTSDANSLDGLAAFLAARIRTKAELKQVGTNQIQNITSNSINTPADNSLNNKITNQKEEAPPKLNNKEKILSASLLPRRRLFSRSEEDVNAPTNPLINNTSVITNNIVPVRVSALRSSSETSVFDFRESDSEGEMPVLERQSLDDMRRDRKSLYKTPYIPDASKTEVINNMELEMKKELMENEMETDPFFSEACDKFLEQLKTTNVKKRGRKKKIVEPDVIAKLETVVTKDKPIENCNLEPVVKLENIKVDQIQAEIKDSIATKDPIKIEKPEGELKENTENTENNKPPQKENIELKDEVKTEESNNKVEESSKMDDDSDSDVPLARRLTPVKQERIQSDDEDSNFEPKKEKLGAKIKIEYSSDSSVSDSETIQSVSDKLRSRKLKETRNDKGMVLRSADSSPSKKMNALIKKKAIFGDGSDFHPGWEEEVYKYKRSLRMPARLINITRAPHTHRMSTSLPDLDPCSPAASSMTDDTEFIASFHRRSLPPSTCNDSSISNKIKREAIDSDVDSNCSFTFSLQKGSYDSEASCSSLKSSTPVKKSDDKNKNKENNNSILDLLVERYSKYKRKRKSNKEQLKTGPKIIPKSANSLELLPTPSLGIGTPEKDKDSVKKTIKGKTKNKEDLKDKDENSLEVNNSVYLGFFRKETVNNFRDTFKKNSGFLGIGEQFSTVVLKSRTRTETRVMKQRATIREVFGEERPASAPPIACREDEISQDSIKEETFDKDKKSEIKPQLQAGVKLKPKEINNFSPIRAGLRSASGRKTKHLILAKKIRGRKRTNNLLKELTTKQVSEVPPEDASIKSETPSIISETPSIKSETPSEMGDEITEINSGISIPTKKRLKLRNMRRKFSSGFDYIRKKKKIVKKESGEPETGVKVKRRGIIPRPSPESVQDIQREIKTWVMNKGIGETHLHRAARLGYTDVTAYCLEKMDCPPSPKDNAGYTPLHEACSRGHLDIARLLLQYGANVSASAQGGIRPLHEAAENGFVEIIRLLLSYGADPMLATYSGLTPLSLATDEETKALLKYYIADMQGLPAPPWSFKGPASCFDPSDSGFDPLSSPPPPEAIADDEDIEIEMSEHQLPNLYTLRGESPTDRWVLLQDLSTILKIKSRDTLLRQINGNAASTSTNTAVVANNKNVLRELKFSDFMEQAHCCQLLCANEKLNVRSSKIALVKYTDKVRQLLGVERVVVTAR